MGLRVQTSLSLYIFTVLGMFLLVVPWSPIWERATLVFIPTILGGWTRSDWVRGVISGLGALNLLAAARDAELLWKLLTTPNQEEGS